jgi:hypothetical protein
VKTNLVDTPDLDYELDRATGTLCHIPCDVVIKNVGFVEPDQHLGSLFPDHPTGTMKAPIWITKRIVKMQGERPYAVPNQPGADAEARKLYRTNIPASIVLFADVQYVIYSFYRYSPSPLLYVCPVLTQLLQAQS